MTPKHALRLACNTALVVSGLDRVERRLRNQWRSFRYDPSKSLQENVAFSHRPDVDDAIRRMHVTLEGVASSLQDGARVLEIGSGTGLYARDLAPRLDVTGLDISSEMVRVARRTCPGARFVEGDFLSTDVGTGYGMIYSISVLQYFPASAIGALLRKVHACLGGGGLLFLQYPHALSRADLWYPHLDYIRHSPRRLQRAAAPLFDVLEHRHSYTPEKRVDDYDPNPVWPDSFAEGYLLVARKREAGGMAATGPTARS